MIYMCYRFIVFAENREIFRGVKMGDKMIFHKTSFVPA